MTLLSVTRLPSPMASDWYPMSFAMHRVKGAREKGVETWQFGGEKVLAIFTSNKFFVWLIVGGQGYVSHPCQKAKLNNQAIKTEG